MEGAQARADAMSVRRRLESWVSSGAGGIGVLVVLSLALSVLVARHIPLPLSGDQALYVYGASRIADGAALYRDFWDIKAPGVYLFYLSAGSLFGFSAAGLHLLEGLWLAAAACFAYAICRTATAGSRVAHLAPFATIGTYFVAATPWHLSQPDGLVALPIVLGAWGLVAYANASVLTLRSMFVAGLAAAGAASFVTSMGLVVVGFAIVATSFEWFCGHTPGVKRVALRVLAFCGGAGLVIASALWWFHGLGALEQSLWTIIAYPAIAQAEFARDVPKLLDSAKWFLGSSIWWLPAAAAGAFATLRQAVRRERRALAGLLMMSWLVTGAAGLLMQYHYSWQFHFNQFFVPVGALAIIGLAYVAGEFKNGVARFVCGAVMVAAILFSLLVAAKVIRVDVPEDPDRVITASVREGLADFRPGDSVYIFGDPRLVLASGHEQAVAQNGWVLDVLVEAQWPVFSAALKESAPTFIYVAPTKRRLLARRAPDLLAWFEKEYRVVSVDGLGGEWMRRRADGTAELPRVSGSPEGTR